MKDRKSESTASQIAKSLKSICYLLTILFCTLRACDVIAWNWFWVMSPIFTLEALWLICGLIVGVVEATTEEKNNN